jgi:SAM-dependent methyltransferase
VEKAKALATRNGITNVSFQAADIFNLPFGDEIFDHIFVCFVLEHLARPAEALTALKRVLKKGGTITVIEGDHGSCCFHPESPEARSSIQCLIDLQKSAGGNALIGRELYPVIASAGFRDVRVSPRMVYVDASRPELVEGFTMNTFTAMVEGVRGPALASGMIDEKTWDRGIAGLYRTTASDGVFCYTFFKGTGIK